MGLSASEPARFRCARSGEPPRRGGEGMSPAMDTLSWDLMGTGMDEDTWYRSLGDGREKEVEEERGEGQRKRQKRLC